MKGADVLTAMALAMVSTAALAHGGGLDANGCHHDRKRGGYHCHRGGGGSPPPRPRTTRTPAYEPPRVQSFLTVPDTQEPADAQVEIVQKMLARLGYDPGEADGRLGPKTRRAIIEFQRDVGLPQTGAVSDGFVDALIRKLSE